MGDSRRSVAAESFVWPRVRGWVEGRPVTLACEELAEVDFPSGSVVMSISSWDFGGVALPAIRPGTWRVERVMAVDESGNRSCVAAILGDGASVATWKPVPARIETALERCRPAVHVAYDAARNAEVLGLRGAQPWDFESSQERMRRAMNEKAYVIGHGGASVGVVLDLMRQRTRPAVWVGSDDRTDPVALFFDLQDWQVDEPEPDDPSGVRVVRPLELGSLRVGPTGAVLVADPAAGLEGGVVAEIGKGEHPVTLWALGSDRADALPRGCALVVGEPGKAETWDLVGAGFVVDAGTGIVLDATEAEALRAHLADEDHLTPAMKEVMQRGWSAVEMEGRRAGLAFDCGQGDGTYDVWIGRGPDGRPVALLADLELGDLAEEIRQTGDSVGPASWADVRSTRERQRP